MNNLQRINRALKRFPNVTFQADGNIPLWRTDEPEPREVKIILTGRGMTGDEALLNALGLVVRDKKKKTNNRAT